MGNGNGYAPIPNVTVIGFTGHAGHGKDLAASYIVEVVPHLARRFAFSDAIAAYCRVRHGMKQRDPRLMQMVGHTKREQQPGVWIDALYWTIHDFKPRVALVTSVRFHDEVALIRAMGGHMVRIVRLNDDGTPYVSGDRDPNHPTEAEIDRLPAEFTVTHRTSELAEFRDSVLSLYGAIAQIEEARL